MDELVRVPEEDLVEELIVVPGEGTLGEGLPFALGKGRLGEGAAGEGPGAARLEGDSSGESALPLRELWSALLRALSLRCNGKEGQGFLSRIAL